MVNKVSRNVTLQEAGKCSETSEIMTKPLLQIIEEMEARTREALKLAKELEDFFRTAD